MIRAIGEWFERLVAGSALQDHGGKGYQPGACFSKISARQFGHPLIGESCLLNTWNVRAYVFKVAEFSRC